MTSLYRQLLALPDGIMHTETNILPMSLKVISTMNHIKIRNRFFGAAIALAVVTILSGCGGGGALVGHSSVVPCTPDDSGLTYRDPASLNCVSQPTQEQKTNFYIFDRLYMTSVRGQIAITARGRFRQPISTRTLLSSIDSSSTQATATFGFRFPDVEGGMSVPVRVMPYDSTLSSETLVASLRASLARTGVAQEVTNSVVSSFLQGHALVATFTFTTNNIQLINYWHRNAAMITSIMPELPQSDWPHLQSGGR